MNRDYSLVTIIAMLCYVDHCYILLFSFHVLGIYVLVTIYVDFVDIQWYSRVDTNPCWALFEFFKALLEIYKPSLLSMIDKKKFYVTRKVFFALNRASVYRPHSLQGKAFFTTLKISPSFEIIKIIKNENSRKYFASQKTVPAENVYFIPHIQIGSSR